MTKYAVLISGGKADSGYDEFWNDLVLMRMALIKNRFSRKHIFVLYGDGIDYNDTNRTYQRYHPSPITNFPADTINVNNVFNGLAKGTNGMPQLTDRDKFFVWTFGHGRPGLPVVKLSPPSFSLRWNLVLNNEELLDNETFASLVNQVPSAYRVICMQQCFSGGFIDSLKNDDKNVILTACSSIQIANRCDDKATVENESQGGVTYHHGEFNYHLLSSITGCTISGSKVNADVNGDNRVTMDEVFNYIKNNDSIWMENPQYNDGNQGIGSTITLR
jgi:hypothetical protein